MAGRVNVKFVVTLSAGLLIAFGVVATSAVLLLKNSAKDLAIAGTRPWRGRDRQGHRGLLKGRQQRTDQLGLHRQMA